MDWFVAITGLATISFITPGPNNLIVLGAAARGGLRAAMPLAAGVVVGTLALLFLAWSGLAIVLSEVPSLNHGVKLAGTLYLIWLGAAMLMSRDGQTADTPSSTHQATLPASFGGLMFFQFLNPKAWVLVLTVTAARPGGATDIMLLAAVFAVASSLCLALWAWTGATLAVWLENENQRRWFDRAMGTLLIGSAALLLL